MPGLYALIGDSNVRRHMSPQNCRNLPHMSGAQVKICGQLSALAEVIRSVSPETTIIILACLTNFLTSADGESSSAAIRVQPVLLEFRDIIVDFCLEYPDRWLV